MGNTNKRFGRISCIKGFGFYDAIFFIAVAFWVIETSLFGFNGKPNSNIERLCDRIAIIIMCYGGLGSFIQAASSKVVIINNIED